jgi:Uma2 family endonuclease
MGLLTQPAAKIIYPESDGEPMASNTIQYEQMVTTKGNLELIFLDSPDVFVASDLFWYPVEGRAEIRVAPDAMVVFGRPKGHRPSYLQWLEDNIPPQVVFEIASPSNRPSEWVEKFHFYQRYGVEEYYIHNPDSGEWDGYLRHGDELIPIKNMEGWTSPRLGIRFEKAAGDETGLFYPDGHPFHSFTELGEMVQAERQKAEAERQKAEAERQRAERLAQKLREMGVEVE